MANLKRSWAMRKKHDEESDGRRNKRPGQHDAGKWVTNQKPWQRKRSQQVNPRRIQIKIAERPVVEKGRREGRPMAQWNGPMGKSSHARDR